jgi:hypothetical protein
MSYLLLQICILLSPLLGDLLLAELSCLALQHGHPLFMCEVHLRTHGNQAASDVIVVLSQQINRKHHIVDVVEHERMLVRVLLLLRQERDWMIAPMTERIEVMGSVVAVVVAVSVALSIVSLKISLI